MERIALIDFCGTVVNFQTFDAFLNFIIMNEYPQRYRIINNLLFIYLFKLITRILRIFGWNGYLYKNILVSQLKGISIGQFQKYGEKFYRQRIKGNFIEQTINLIKELKTKDYRIIIVSGGSHFYIERFSEEFGINDIISAQIQFKKDKCTGVLKTDCLGKNKVKLIKEYCYKNKINGIFDVAVSDSVSDLPLLDLCRQKIVISHNSSQKWIRKDMEEIIWQ